ncbi:MAG: T9SS type A sorting domain-containing protein [Candidatus Limimorpha sp.]
MKKTLLISLGLVLGLSATAQYRIPQTELKAYTVNSKKEIVGDEKATGTMNYVANPTQSPVIRWESMNEAAVMMTTYDLQSNAYVSNRMYQAGDGSVAVVATMSHESNQTVNDRGTGYNFCQNGDFSKWGNMPENRIESMKTGWPTIATVGANGEILVSHADGLNCWIRTTKGEGEWEGPIAIPNPEGTQYPYKLSWARAATSGTDNNIVHVISGAQHKIDNDHYSRCMFYSRSTDGGQTWITDYSPLRSDSLETDVYSNDSYAIATNGNNVAILYTGSLQAHVLMYKSTDNGQTWQKRIVWENPYNGIDWDDPQSVYTDTVYGPANGAIAIDNNGVVHVALNVYEYIHSEVGTSYTVFRGLTSDGIAYWNDTETTPITDADGNPHDALRLWKPAAGGGSMHGNNESRFCGWIPPKEDGSYEGFELNKLYAGDDYFYHFYGQSACPAFSIDPQGNIAVAYSSPNITRNDGNYYFRNIYVSSKEANTDTWKVATDNLMNDFAHQFSDGIYTHSVNNVKDNASFWFSYQEDETIGLFWGYKATQANASDNNIVVSKVVLNFTDVNEVTNPMNSVTVRPNPVQDMLYIDINASQASDMNVAVYNITGQKVLNQSVSDLSTGVNTRNINVSNLTSGIYFVTVTANGFQETKKFIVQ